MQEPVPEVVLSLLAKVTAEDVRYIKLGRRNSWWHRAKETRTLLLGFREFDFELCKAGDFERASAPFAAARPTLRPDKITSATRQVREFFKLPQLTLWFTLADGDLWWCFAHEGVTNLYEDQDDTAAEERGAKSRNVIKDWFNIDINGARLQQDAMTTRITKVIAYQETICEPDGREALLRLIRCLPSEEHRQAHKALADLVRHLGSLLDQLHQSDFELLIELIFSSSGWRRISTLGGNQKFFDLTMTLPTTGEKCGVQVKSQTNAKVISGFAQELVHYGAYERAFFAYHTPPKAFDSPFPSKLVIWNQHEIARQAINAGLAEWIMQRTT